MSKIAIRGGHSLNCRGASGLIDETLEDRKVYPSVIKYLKLAGNEVLDVTSNLSSQTEDLAYGVNKANKWGADLFISIHFNNAYRVYNGAIGTETIIYPNSKSAYPYAKRINDNLADLGFKNRGVKHDSRGLYELRHTKCPAVITEVCFVEATKDVALYKKLGADRIGKAIAEGIVGHKINVDTPEKKKSISKPTYQKRYVLEFQKFYNQTTKTKKPISEDGIYGKNTKKAYETMGKLIRGEY